MAARALAALLVTTIGTAYADEPVGQDALPGHAVVPAVDGGVLIAAFSAGLLAKLIPMREPRLWDTELVGADRGVHDNWSRRADTISDVSLGLALAAPVVYLTGSTIDDADGDRLLLYGQSLGITTAIASVTKQLVQRPRPYMYSRDRSVGAFAKEHGKDSYLSFFSGHSSLSFTAATAGAYLLGASGESKAATSVAWGAGFGLAAMTATLRVRAGMHFYSDVVVGAVVGIAVGYAVPALHATEDAYTPTGGQVALAGASILTGVLIGRLIPLKRESEGAPASWLSVAPTMTEGGVGVAIGGGW